MRAMVLAAGLGTRLRPLTFEIPKPMVPVLDRPVMAHIIDLLNHHDFNEVIANLHFFPETITAYFGDEIATRYEETLLGTAGGVRNCSDFLTGGEDDSFLVISGDALTDIDLARFVDFHRHSGGIATLAAKAVSATSEYGVIVADGEGRISGFQEKPDPAQALSDLANCGIYLLRKEIFDYFPDRPFVDWATDVFPKLLELDVPFFVHDIGGEYWNDVGSLQELRSGTFDALGGELRLSGVGLPTSGETYIGHGSSNLASAKDISGPVWIGEDVQISSGVRLHGPLVIGDRAVVGANASLRDSIVLPGTQIARDTILIGAIAGHSGIVNALTPRRTAAKAD